MQKIIKLEKKALRQFFDHFEWIHITLGLFGNLTFFLGSIFFLYEDLKTTGIWLFIIGAFFMLVGSIGSALVKYTYNHRDKHKKNKQGDRKR